MLLPHGYNTFMVGKWHLTPPEHETAGRALRPLAVGPRVRALLRVPGWRHQPVVSRAGRTTTTTSSAGAPEDGYHLSIDLADKAIEFVKDAHVNAPDKPFYLHYCTGAGHAPHHVPKEWADRYAGKFDARVGRVPHGRPPAPARHGHPPRRHRTLRRPTPTFPAWDTLSRGPAAAVCPDDGGLRRLPQLHRPPLRSDPGLPRGDRRARQHPDHGGLGQRRQLRGRTVGFGQRDVLLQQRRRDTGGEPGPARRPRWPQGVQPLPVGVDERRQHPVPALEARDLPRWGQRPLHRVLAEADHRRAARPAPSTRTSSTWSPPSSMPWTSRPRRPSGAWPRLRSRASASPTPSTPPTQPPSTTPSTSRCSATASIYHDGWRAVCPWPGPNFTEAAKKGRAFSTPITPEVLADIEANDWELYDLDRRCGRDPRRRRRAP